MGQNGKNDKGTRTSGRNVGLLGFQSGRQILPLKNHPPCSGPGLDTSGFTLSSGHVDFPTSVSDAHRKRPALPGRALSGAARIEPEFRCILHAWVSQTRFWFQIWGAPTWFTHAFSGEESCAHLGRILPAVPLLGELFHSTNPVGTLLTYPTGMARVWGAYARLPCGQQQCIACSACVGAAIVNNASSLTAGTYFNDLWEYNLKDNTSRMIMANDYSCMCASGVLGLRVGR